MRQSGSGCAFNPSVSSCSLSHAAGVGDPLPDDAVRAIVETGALSVEEDEPLDMREIEAEEERFWRETWDEPEEV